jgi:hypothetical protein
MPLIGFQVSLVSLPGLMHLSNVATAPVDDGGGTPAEFLVSQLHHHEPSTPGSIGEKAPSIASTLPPHQCYVHPDGWVYYHFPKDDFVTANDPPPPLPNRPDFPPQYKIEILIENGELNYINHDLQYASKQQNDMTTQVHTRLQSESLCQPR